MASSVAQKRLFHEYKNLSTNPPEGITAGPVTEDDMFHWEALIQGPEGTPFEGGVFAAELKFPRDYPLSPPTMKFIGGGVWHPNGTCPRHWLARVTQYLCTHWTSILLIHNSLP
jgi:ubiquitin-conjugating enzyme E2 G2